LRIERPPVTRASLRRSEELRDAGAHRFHDRLARSITMAGSGRRRTVIVHVLDLQCGTGA